jgi:hypothetical protein
MHLKIESEDELKDIAAKLLHHLVNLRHAQNEWYEDRGSEKLRKKHYWERKVDDLLVELKAGKTHHQKEIHISIEPNEENS